MSKKMDQLGKLATDGIKTAGGVKGYLVGAVAGGKIGAAVAGPALVVPVVGPALAMAALCICGVGGAVLGGVVGYKVPSVAFNSKLDRD